MTNLKDKVIIITGATQGIGLATAKLLGSLGAQVALIARSKKDLENTAKEIPGSFPISTDMRDPIEIKNMILAVLEKFGRIDILINNAAQGLNASIETINIDDYRKIFELNVIGSLVAMQEVIPVMRRQKEGQIVNISSVASKEAIPYMAAYASTKYALNCLSLTARGELEKDTISVTLVHPDLTDTNFGDNLMADNETKTKMKEFFSSLPPADSPELVAEKILHAIQTREAEVYVREE